MSAQASLAESPYANTSSDQLDRLILSHQAMVILGYDGHGRQLSAAELVAAQEHLTAMRAERYSRKRGAA